MMLVVARANAAFPTAVNATPDQSAAAKSPAVAADSSNGTAVIAWVRALDSHVMIRRVNADGSYGDAQDVSGEPNKSAALAATTTSDPAGNVTVVWTRNDDDHLVAVRIPAGGSAGSVIDVSQQMVAFSSQSNAAADGLGIVHFVWRRNNDS